MAVGFYIYAGSDYYDTGYQLIQVIKKKDLEMTRESIGTILTSLGGLIVILNLTIWNNSEYGLISAIGAVVVILAGLYFTSWKKDDSDVEK